MLFVAGAAPAMPGGERESAAGSGLLPFASSCGIYHVTVRTTGALQCSMIQHRAWDTGNETEPGMLLHWEILMW